MKTLNQKKIMHYKSIVYVIVIIIFSSCSTGMKIRTKNFIEITNDFSGTFNVNPHNVQSKHKTNFKPEILFLFNIDNKVLKAKKVHINFDKNHDLVVSYKGLLGIETKHFNGKFNKKGYYEIHISKERITVPPLFPILYSRTNIDRIRIGLSKNGNLIIDKYLNRTSNIFLLAGGSVSRSQSFYKKIK